MGLNTLSNNMIVRSIPVSNSQVRNKAAFNSAAISFGYDSPLREVAKHCAYCGTEMLTDAQADSLIHHLLNSEGKTLQKYVKDLNRRLKHSTKSSSIISRLLVTKKLLLSSPQNPDKTGSKHLASYLQQNQVNLEDEIQEQNPEKEQVFADLTAMKPQLPEYTQQLIDDLIELNPARLITVLHGIEVIKKKCDKEDIKLPKVFRSYHNKAFKKVAVLKHEDMLKVAHQDTPRALLNKMVEPLKVTMEHVHPHSKNGDDDTSNYLPVCGECNSERGNIDFTEALRKKPDIAVFIKSALQEVKRAIDQLINPPQELEDYIDNICHTLKVESEGQLDIVV